MERDYIEKDYPEKTTLHGEIIYKQKNIQKKDFTERD